MNDTKELPTWLLILFSWSFTAYFLGTFLVYFHTKADLSQSSFIHPVYYLYLILGISFAFLPFMKRINIGKLLELERDIRETKSEVKSFKEEVRQMISIISTNVNTIGDLSNTVNVNNILPGKAEMAEEIAEVEQSSDPDTLLATEEIKDELSLKEDDTIMSLARTRITLEGLMRKILGKRIKEVSDSKEVKFMSFGKLYRRFLKEYSDYRNLENSFAYVGTICNAAIHAQRVSDGQASEALDLGSKLIAILNKIEKNQENGSD